MSTLPPAGRAPITISADHARRFLVRHHLLDPPRSLPAEPESVLRVVERIGLLQFDPLEVPGARNHDLVLHARIAGYRREWCDRWLYGPPGERRLFEAYNKSLNILPLHELPYYRLTWDRMSARHDEGILRERAATAAAILETLRRDGPQSTAAFNEHHGAVDWYWAPTREARAVLEALFMAGRVGIARRDGNRRYYDLIERLFPADLLARRVSVDEAMRHRLLSRYRSIGLIGPSPNMEVLLGTGTAAERALITRALVDDGTLLELEIDGLRGRYRMLAEEAGLLAETAAASADRDAGVTFLAPLDPLAWDRRLLRTLFGFNYLWEVYVPAARRRYGYYVLPILFGDRLVGRIEPRLERATRILRIVGLGFEDGFDPLDTAFVRALAESVRAYRSFVGAGTVSWSRGAALAPLARAVRTALLDQSHGR